MSRQSATFCVIPWLHRHTDEQGFQQMCCVGIGKGNVLRGPHGDRLHVEQQLTDAEVLNSPTLKGVRREMLHGQWPAACARCRQSEEAGSESIRMLLNARHGAAWSDLVSQTGPDGTLEQPVVRYADIRLGNACNLTCRMCGPAASRLWAGYFNVVQPPHYRLPADSLRVLGENNWVKQQPLAFLLEQCLPTVERLHFAGGEPLIVPEMADALEQCIASGRAPQIELSYNTNLTVLPEKITSLWRSFRGVSLLCSVDAYGRLNDYIRRPSKWRDIDANLRAVDRNWDAWNIRSAAVSATVQMYNALNIHQLFEYLGSSEFTHIAPVPQLVPLFDPRYLSIQCLPAAAKTIARQRLQAELERAEAQGRPSLRSLIGSVRSTLRYLDAADKTAYLADFFYFTEASDEAFADSWREAAPELAAQLEPHHQDVAPRLAALRSLAIFSARNVVPAIPKNEKG
jgi:hypothetical protein